MSIRRQNIIGNKIGDILLLIFGWITIFPPGVLCFGGLSTFGTAAVIIFIISVIIIFGMWIYRFGCGYNDGAPCLQRRFTRPDPPIHAVVVAAPMVNQGPPPGVVYYGGENYQMTTMPSTVAAAPVITANSAPISTIRVDEQPPPYSVAASKTPFSYN